MMTCFECAGNRIMAETCICPNDAIPNIKTPYCSLCDFVVVDSTFTSELDSINVAFPFPVTLNVFLF